MNEKVEEIEKFYKLPKLFSSVEDITTFINNHSDTSRYPVLLNLLKLRSSNGLELTPTESEFYFYRLFEYIYDVYRIPNEETFNNVIDWLDDIESRLVHSGMSGVIEWAYMSINSRFDSAYTTSEILEIEYEGDYNNFYTNIPTRNSDYYVRKNAKEQFWIKSSKYIGQPVEIGDEAYMRVIVYDDHVYIFGCDDAAYSWVGPDINKFVLYLKHAAPVWNFGHFNYEGFEVNN